ENTRKQERLLLKDPAGYLESYGYNFTTTNFNGQVVKLTLFTFDNPLERE
ncbi:MAG: GLPGLI family protein, partial [Prevotella sp.]|nr:GLPGLI family protein [Prevotella sp.]